MSRDNIFQDSTVINPDDRKIRSAGILIKKGLLVILSENFFGKSFLIEKSETMIGRGKKCDVSIKDPLISRAHCKIVTDESGSFFVEDLGSKNSTYLNKRVLKKRSQLFYGDRIVIGNTILRFFLEEKVEKR